MAQRTGQYDLGSSEEIICDKKSPSLNKSIDKNAQVHKSNDFDNIDTDGEKTLQEEINVQCLCKSEPQ